MRKFINLGLTACITAALLLAAAAPARADAALLAVAANFAETADLLARAFEQQSGHSLTITTGSTGKLYAQIINGAPFDIFLAADQKRPKLLENSGDAVSGSRKTYATGQLSLWSADKNLIGKDAPALLKAARFRSLAIANPKLAPYGRAARQVLQSLDLWEAVKDRVVMGQNAGQTFALIASGNAELGFVARSYLLSPRNTAPGSHWHIPAHLHAPVHQDAILLGRAAANPAAMGFMRFLNSPQAATIIRKFGYGVK